MTLSHLDKFTSSEGYWHDADMFKKTIEQVLDLTNAKNMLEIGFNIGYSASMWLNTNNNQLDKLISVDIGMHKDTLAASEAVKDKYGDRFTFVLSDSTKAEHLLSGHNFDIAFIDGAHEYNGVVADIEMCVSLKIPYLIFDDYHVNDGPHGCVNGVKAACYNNKDIEPVTIYFPPKLASQVAVYKVKV